MAEDNVLLHKGNLIELHKERVEFPNGGHSHFDIVKHPGGAVIAAINANEEICMLQQWRHAVQQTIWELPAGCLEQDEPALNAAVRELEEEAGVTANQWRDLGQITPSPGYSNEVLFLFEARDLQLGKMNLDEAEQIDVHWLALGQIENMVRNGTIIDAKSLALLYKLCL